MSTSKTPSGLIIEELLLGEGATAAAGQSVTVHYTGWLASGSKFDSSKDRNDPFVFNLGSGQVIRGWDEMLTLMKQGDKVQVIIPFWMAYGEQAMGDKIPPYSTLVFDMELKKLIPKK